MTIEDIIKKFEGSKGEHSKFVELYRDVYKFGMPERYGNIERTEKGVKATDNVFTSVFEEACDGFVQKIQSLLTPVHTPWVMLEPGEIWNNEDLQAQKDDAKDALSKISDVINTFKDNSNFDRTMSQFYYELIAGTGTLLVMPGTPEKPLRFTSIPFKDIYMVEGAFGEIDMFFRTQKIKNRLIEKQWEGAKHTYDEQEADKEIEILEATYYDYDSKEWNYEIINLKDKTSIYKKTSQTCPFVEFRWGKITGETYGRGQGLKVIADCKTLNLLKYYSLVSLSFTLPVYTVKSEDIDPERFKLSPGALNPVRDNATNNPPVSALPVNQQPDLQQYNMVQLEMNIKRGMYASTIPNDPDRKTTATEISARVNELENVASNSYGSAVEFIYKLVQRMVDVLGSFGFLELSEDQLTPNKIDGMNFKVKLNSNLTNQQAAKEVSNTLQALQFMQSLDPTMQYTSKVLDINKLAPYILERLGIKPEFIRSADEIAQIEQQEAQAMQMQQQQAMMDDVAMSNAKEEGKANAKAQVER